MSAPITLATAGRVLRQVRRDPRTLALVLVVPPVLLTLFKFVFEGQPQTFDRIAPPMVGGDRPIRISNSSRRAAVGLRFLATQRDSSTGLPARLRR